MQTSPRTTIACPPGVFTPVSSREGPDSRPSKLASALTELEIDLAAHYQRMQIERALKERLRRRIAERLEHLRRGRVNSDLGTSKSSSPGANPSKEAVRPTTLPAPDLGVCGRTHNKPHASPETRLETSNATREQTDLTPALGEIPANDAGRAPGPDCTLPTPNLNAACFDQVHVFPKGRWP
jgi:hypothetical protein